MSSRTCIHQYPEFKRNLEAFSKANKVDTVANVLTGKIEGSHIGKIERYLKTHVISRLVAPLFGLIGGASAVVHLPINAFEHLVGGLITFDLKQLAVGTGFILNTPIAAIALPLIGICGAVSPKKASELIDKMPQLAYPAKNYPPLRGRIMCLFLSITALPKIVASTTATLLASLVVNISLLAIKTLAAGCYGVSGALWRSPMAQQNLGVIILT